MEYNKKIQEDIEFLDPFVVESNVTNYEQTNPFYVPLEGSEVRYIKTKILAEEYKYVYILCLVDDIQLTTANKNKIKLFYQSESDISELKGQSKLVKLVRGPFGLINQSTIRSGVIVIQKKILEHFNHDANELDEKELVYMMLETKESNVKSWLKLYQEDNTLDEFIEKKIFSSYYKLQDPKMEIIYFL